MLCKAGEDVVTRKKRRAVAKGEVRVRKQFLCGLADRDGVLWMSGDGPAAADLVIVDVRPDKSYLLGWVDRQHFVVFKQ